MNKKPELFSSKLCPYVQRSVITLREKGVDFDLNYINLRDKPDWFLAISPLGKVPVLKMDDQIIFESAVINEYLDETHKPHFMSDNPSARARDRMWIAFCSALQQALTPVVAAQTKLEFTERKQLLHDKLSQVEKAIEHGPFFNGDRFSLVDTTFAPFFMRLRLLEDHYKLDLIEDLPKVKTLCKRILAKDSVKQSVVPEFPQLYLETQSKREGFLNKQA